MNLRKQQIYLLNLMHMFLLPFHEHLFINLYVWIRFYFVNSRLTMLLKTCAHSSQKKAHAVSFICSFPLFFSQLVEILLLCDLRYFCCLLLTWNMWCSSLCGLFFIFFFIFRLFLLPFIRFFHFSCIFLSNFFLF